MENKSQKVSFKILQETGYGIGFHWTTWTAPPSGKRKNFPQAVKDFDVEAFVQQAKAAGAGNVLFTATHALHWLPGPNHEVDRILPGRTCERDLIMEIADGLNEYGIKLMLYYNHGTYKDQDPEWQEAVGSRKKDKQRYFDNYCRIVRWMGEHYGEKVIAFWFDSGYAFAQDPQTPWKEMTAAARAGNPKRLICYNPGIEQHKLYTPYQDYWAGEVCRLNYIPRGLSTPTGLPWYSFTSWHAHSKNPLCGEWGINEENRHLNWPAPAVESVVNYLKRFQKTGGTVTFNLLCYQDGSVYPSDLEVMRKVKKIMC